MLIDVLLLVTVLYILGVAVKYWAKFRFCVLCGSISLAWISLLILFKLNHFHDQTLIAILIGQSITGIFYYAQRHLNRALRIFTLPFFLTLTIIADWLVSGHLAVITVFGFLMLLWLMAYLLFIGRLDPGKKTVAKAVMKCCEED